METTLLEEITQGKSWIGLAIAGNQAGHLDQAGETQHFKAIDSVTNAPKGMFPWYIPDAENFLKTNPISSSKIKTCGNDPLQPEPEIALVVQFNYTEGGENLINGIKLKGFTAFNDCSRRISAPKLSLKKNWGPHSQGMAKNVIKLEDFSAQSSILNQYRLGCYLIRDGKLNQYGEDTAAANYTYFNEQLVEWMITQINQQKDDGPLEELSTIMREKKPLYGVIAIGATAYVDFGNSDQKFLQKGDTVIITAYDGKLHSKEQIESLIQNNELSSTQGDYIVLRQTVTD